MDSFRPLDVLIWQLYLVETGEVEYDWSYLRVELKCFREVCDKICALFRTCQCGTYGSKYSESLKVMIQYMEQAVEYVGFILCCFGRRKHVRIFEQLCAKYGKLVRHAVIWNIEHLGCVSAVEEDTCRVM